MHLLAIAFTSCLAASSFAASAAPEERGGRAASPHRFPAALDRPARAPAARSLSALVEAAWAHADLRMPRRRAWIRRVRAATLLPEVSAGYDHRRGRGWDHHLQLDAPDELDTDGSLTQTFRVRATWDLSRLVYSNDELRVTQTTLDIQSRRATLRSEVQALFERRQAQIAAWTLTAPHDPHRADLETEIRQLTQALEVLCGVEF
jgi:hypothetical protein